MVVRKEKVAYRDDLENTSKTNTRRGKSNMTIFLEKAKNSSNTLRDIIIGEEKN